ncbi:prolyl 4-hydroxylase subunit alpha-2-like isoform X2 [Tigriopus californicus]|uniref:prolyl 4-hydroxylase subunit alpha-2-like isoform X2 n=1 Tax=Tigriopus californicus TaxID=6832 RepID=UPI0027DA4975|nr:prolyl 4-hydroxylase subunit alpha-2-like isoform X2 [Tigriopus californicus]XP_059097165.1 prolyl 4-hydroxylase subunit alpha-2-like isoform X2 [Tigriopus californicus]XP_059097173.1 prolyl 4-hydroxylase subunit alpha-2-like isoform X2 [Tigriopus californicus]
MFYSIFFQILDQTSGTMAMRLGPELIPWLIWTTIMCLPALVSTEYSERIAETPERDLFTSNEALANLFKQEEQMRHSIEAYVARLDRQIHAMDQLINNHEHNSTESEEDAAEYVSNPINAYVLLKRTGIEWPKLRDGLFSESFINQTKEIEELIEHVPKVSDLEGATNGIFLLQETYDLDMKEFALGRIRDPQTGEMIEGQKQLSAFDLELLGKLSFNRGFYDRATEWIDAAIWMAKRSNASEQIIQNFQGMLRTMQNKHDVVLEKKGPRNRSWRTFLVPFDEKLRKKKKYKKIKNKRYQPGDKADGLDQNLWEKFNALCRGEEKKSPAQLQNLTCHYLHYKDPYLRLGPFKLEQKSLLPYIAVFHDFMYDKEMEDYRSNVNRRLIRSMHLTKKGEHDGVSVKRTSSQAWLDDRHNTTKLNGTDSSAMALKVSRRLQIATRFHVLAEEGGEMYQVANYGIGGVYNHHTDSSGEFGISKERFDNLKAFGGDRIGTAMGYLSDVRAGGATVFPNAKVTIWPKRGNLAFWYNNDYNGRVDFLTFHGGCPVLAGSKWITNKWIRSWWQVQHFPCKTTSDTYHRIKPIDNDFCKMTHNCDIPFVAHTQ